MLFTESFLTDAGVALLARAISEQGTIKWTLAATSSLDTSSYTTAQMNAITTATFGTKTSSGAVTNAMVNDSQDSVTIYSELTNSEYSGDAKLYGAWAQIDGDESDVLVVVARCGEGVNPTYINSASDGVVKAFVDFALSVTASQAQAIQVGEGYYATASALQDEQDARLALASRVVTTHSQGDTTSGDEQNVLGFKIFKDGIESGLCINSHAHNVDGQVCTYGYGYETGYTGVRIGFFDDTEDDRDDVNNWNCYIEAMSSGTPDGVSQYSNNLVKLSSHGEDNTENCYVVASNGDGEPTASMYTTYLSGGVETQNNVTLLPDDIEIKSRALSSGTETKRSTIEVNPSSVEIKANDTKYARIKTQTKTITVSGSDTQVGEIELYAQGSSGTGQLKITSRETEGASVEIFCNESGVDVNSSRVNLFTDGKIEMSAGSGIEIQSPVSLHADVIPSGQRNIGSLAAPLASLHATSIVGALTGDVTGNVTGNLTGKIPVTAYAQTPPIGSIFLAYITVSASTSAMGIGQIAPGSIRKAQLSIDSNGVVSASFESAIALSSGTYTLLSAIDGLSANGNTIALVMRTS